MTTELTMLVYATILLFVLVLIQATAGVRAQGLKAQTGSRDNMPESGVFQARAKRTVDNHREGLTIFAPLVLVAALAHVSGSWTVIGAQLFFYSRVAHAVTYLAGWPVVRPLIYGVGVAGIVMIMARLLGLGA